jgi:hypothetical protein
LARASSSSSSSRRIENENENETQLYGTLHRSGTTWTTYSRVPEHLERALGEPERETSRCPHLIGAGMTRKPYALISKRESGDSGEGGRVRRGLHCRECWDRLETKRLAAAIVCADCGDCFPLSKTRTYPTVAGGRVRPITTLVPVRPRQRGERRSLRTFSPGVCFSSPAPRSQSRHTSTHFNSASDAFQLHPSERRPGPVGRAPVGRRVFFVRAETTNRGGRRDVDQTAARRRPRGEETHRRGRRE